MDTLIAVSARLARWVLVAAAVSLASLGLVVICGVVMRYALNNEPPFIEQVALLLVISVSMFGAAAGVHGSGHIGLDSPSPPPPIIIIIIVVVVVVVNTRQSHHRRKYQRHDQ